MYGVRSPFPTVVTCTPVLSGQVPTRLPNSCRANFAWNHAARPGVGDICNSGLDQVSCLRPTHLIASVQGFFHQQETMKAYLINEARVTCESTSPSFYWNGNLRLLAQCCTTCSRSIKRIDRSTCCMHKPAFIDYGYADRFAAFRCEW